MVKHQHTAQNSHTPEGPATLPSIIIVGNATQGSLTAELQP